VPLLVHLNQLKWPNIEKPLKARHQDVDNLLVLLVIPVVLPADAGFLAVCPWVEEVECQGSGSSSSS